MPERRDRDNDLDVARDIGSIKVEIEQMKIDIKTNDDYSRGRWLQQDKRFLDLLTRALLLIGFGMMTGNMKFIKDKIMGWLP